jgi:hypothetical protein
MNEVDVIETIAFYRAMTTGFDQFPRVEVRFWRPLGYISHTQKPPKFTDRQRTAGIADETDCIPCDVLAPTSSLQVEYTLHNCFELGWNFVSARYICGGSQWDDIPQLGLANTGCFLVCLDPNNTQHQHEGQLGLYRIQGQ